MRPGRSGTRDDIETWRTRAGALDESIREMVRRARETSADHGTYITVFDPLAPPSGGLLHGVPFAVKDNIAIEGYPTTGGSAAFRGLHLAPTATAVRRLQLQGAMPVGKANLHELALGVTSENGAFGPVRNPSSPGHSAGGSSGGTAAAVASGSVPFALGTDTGGSMTIPAALCGVVGMRPTQQRYPSDGVIKISPTRDTIGVMASRVADVDLVDSVITGESDPGSPWLRIGVPHDGWWSHVSDEVRSAAELALELLQHGGFELVEVDLAEIQEQALAHRFDLVGYEAPRALGTLLGRNDVEADSFEALVLATLSDDVREILAALSSNPVTEDAYSAAHRLRGELAARSDAALMQAGAEMLVYPSTSFTAPSRGLAAVTVEGETVPVFEAATRNTELAAMLDHPMISIPLPVGGDALPIGLTIEAQSYKDRDLLATATFAEALLRDLIEPRGKVA